MILYIKLHTETEHVCIFFKVKEVPQWWVNDKNIFINTFILRHWYDVLLLGKEGANTRRQIKLTISVLCIEKNQCFLVILSQLFPSDYKFDISYLGCSYFTGNQNVQPNNRQLVDLMYPVIKSREYRCSLLGSVLIEVYYFFQGIVVSLQVYNSSGKELS